MLDKIRKKYSILFCKSNDLSTEIGRSNERLKRIAETAMAAMSARIINIVAGLITVPLTLPYLGVEQFGIWMALTGFVALLIFSDLGLSIGLQNLLTKCDGSGDKNTPSYLISSALALVLSITVFLLLFALYLLPYFDLEVLIKLEMESKAVLVETAQAVLIAFSIGLPAAIYQRVFEAYQEGFKSNVLLSIGRLISLISVFYCVYNEISLPVMALLYMGVPHVVMIFGGIAFVQRRAWLRPALAKIRLDSLKRIVGIGGMALSAQIGASIIGSGPLLVLTSHYGALAVVPFIIAQRLFSILSMCLSVALGPLWPAYGEAKEREDYVWIMKTFRKSVFFTVAIALLSCFFMVVAGGYVIEFWTGDVTVVPESDLMIACCIWALLLAGIRVISMLLNGLGVFKGQSIYGLVLPVFSVCLGWYCSDGLELVHSLLVMIFFGEFLRLLFMCWECHSNINSIRKKAMQ